MTVGLDAMTDTMLLKPEPSAESAVSDEALVELLRAGDSQAGQALVGRHSEPLLRYLQRLTGSAQQAEDLHQQTWLGVLEHLDKFRPQAHGSAFKAWLFRIATNKANDQWRARGREETARQGLRLVTEEVGPDASFRMDASEQENKLRRAIGQLSEQQRAVVLLRYYSNLKFVDIAETLGCPLNTALGRMHKAIQKLKSLME